MKYTMKLGKIIKTISSLSQIYLFKKRIPLSVNIHVTDRCNFNCGYCDIWKRNRKEMTTDQIKHLIDQLSELGCQRIGFTGGEPLLRKDIGELIDYTKRKGILSTLVSNGSLVKQRIGELKNLDILAVQLQGPKEIHDEQITKGAYDKVIGAIKAARENNISVWNVVVLTKYNIDQTDFILKKAEELDFYTHFQPAFSYYFSGDNVESILAKKEEYGRVFHKLIKEKKNKRINSSISCLRYFSGYPGLEMKIKCWAGSLFYYIDVDGAVYPCFGMMGRIKAPNFLKTNLKDAINKTEKLSCPGCWCHAYVELNHLMALQPNSIWNWFKLMVKQ